MTTTIPPAQLSSLLAEPAATPPPGIVPNFVDPPSLRVHNFAVMGATWGIATLAFGMRLFVRWWVQRMYVAEDFFILLAWMVADVEAALIIAADLDGGVIHQWDQNMATYFHFNKVRLALDQPHGLSVRLIAAKWVNEISFVYVPTIWLIKVAILLSFIRLFAPNRHVNRWMFYTCWGMIVTLTLVYALDSIPLIIQCTPREKVWKPYIAGHCISATSMLAGYMLCAVFNVVSDFVIMILPLPAICKLQMKTTEKCKVAVLFATAFVSSIIRAYYSALVFRSPDTTWYNGKLGVWIWIELAAGILVFCLPVTPAFVEFVKAKLHRTFPSACTETGSLHSSSRAETQTLPWTDTTLASLTSSQLGHSLRLSLSKIAKTSSEIDIERSGGK